MNPQTEETLHVVALSASREFLDYLLTNALIVDLWGLQGTFLLILSCSVLFNQIDAGGGVSVEQWVPS